MQTNRQNLNVCLLGIMLGLICIKTTHAASNPDADFAREVVEFNSNGVNIVGELYRPITDQSKSMPLVVILGPVGFVKEQAPREYAMKLAQQGFAALIFDPRYHGQSGGLPRRYENGDAKTEDIYAAVDFAQSIKGIDADQIHLLGICQGVNWIARAAVHETRVKSVGLVAGHYLTPEVAELYLGGKDNVRKRLAAAKIARDNYEKTGVVEYIPVVSEQDTNALLTFKAIFDWYIPWANKDPDKNRPGLWENRITRMSELDIWGGDITADISQITLPTLMIHSNKAASGPNIPRSLFELIPAEDKQLVWFGDQFQTLFYDNKEVIGRAVNNLVDRFNTIN